jgi:nucleotidyltransferase substrate binding protein (TIGR01987 family)
MDLDLSPLEKAVASLQESVNIYHQVISLHEGIQRVVKAGVIQNFEFTYELSWKLMKRWLEINISRDAIFGISKKEMFRRAGENGLVDDVDAWFHFNEQRNKTSHIYDELISEDVFETAVAFLPVATALLHRLEERI